jgi:hypothetical protein
MLLFTFQNVIMFTNFMQEKERNSNELTQEK